jgi:ApaG protein
MNQTPDDYNFTIKVKSNFVPEQSDPQRQRYVFSYHITITNCGNRSAQLLARKWIITNGDGKTQEVSGAGVVGQQPVIEPGQQHQYTSGAVLETEVGSMSGHYKMKGEDGQLFNADISPFTLFFPNALH